MEIVFNDVAHYLASRGVDIRFRRHTVSTLASSLAWTSLLDAGCGDGSITVPLLAKETQITLLDLSSSMLNHAQSLVPQDLTGNLHVRQEDLMLADFGRERFDLIVSVGVIAHVEDPALYLAKLRSLLHPGGHLILEFTDAYHLIGRLGRLWSGLKERFAPAKYKTNKLSSAAVKRLLEESHLREVTSFRYSRLPLPGADRLLSGDLHYRLCRWIFGDVTKNRNAQWGNEHICLLAAT